MSQLTGKLLKGRFRVDEFIGRGGMAEVYKVWDSHLSAFLAMKVLREDLAEDHVFLRRFKREARTLAKLQHPNIIRFYGLDQDDIHAFMLMDFVEGTTLRREIFRSGGPTTEKRIVEIFRSICSAVSFAHGEGVIHCDLKPGNIMIDRSGRVLVTDFGIARMTDAATATMIGMGTPAYMAPEQIRGADPSPQTDIYALGVVLFEMLTGGERPFTGEDATIPGSTSEKVRWEQTHLEAPSPRRWNAGVSQEVEQIVIKCLEKDPVQRYQRVQDLLLDLERAIQSPIAELASNGTQTDPIAGPIAALEKAPGREESVQNALQGVPSFIFVGVGVLLVGFVMFMIGRGPSDPSGFPEEPAAEEEFVDDIEPSVDESATFDAETEEALTATAWVTEIIIEPPPGRTPSTSTPDHQATDNAWKAASLTATARVTTRTPTPPRQLSDGTIRLNSIDDAEVIFISGAEFVMGASPDVGYEYCLEHPPSSGVECKRSWYDRESPPHEVRLSSYWVYRTEVSISQYSECVRAGACAPRDQIGRSSRLPVTNVTWNDAREYCQWAAGYDLPTEAQWEYAAKGRTARRWPWGDSTPSSSKLNSLEIGLGEPRSVDSYEAGESYFGLVNIAGNVWEYVIDLYDQYYYETSSASRTDPSGPSSNDDGKRVIRGGAYDGDYNDARTTRRGYNLPNVPMINLGFRCAGSSPP